MTILICLLGERPANPSLLQGYERGWTTLAATSCLPSLLSLTDTGRDGSYGKMSPAFCHPTADGILEPSSGRWKNSGMGSPTAFLTLSTCEQMDTLTQYPKDGGVCSLSDVLEIGVVPQRYFLTAKACAGILRRAEKRGKVLPTQLQAALQAVVEA